MVMTSTNMDNNTMSRNTLAFTEFRLVGIEPQFKRVSEKRLLEVMTLNEELEQYGYTLTPTGVRALALASDNARENFISHIADYIGGVKAKPMYPDFPNQVMNMDEAMFRFQQMVHYFSTYGMEMLFDVEVKKGWLPDVQDTEKTESDARLLNLKVLELIDETKFDAVLYEKIVGKTEKMTDKEAMLLKAIIPNLTTKNIAGINVKFKRNMLDVFYAMFSNTELSTEDKISILRALCQHTGDVWKCMDYALTREGFHLKTSQKRLLVKLLESYNVVDFTANLILSAKKAERTSLMLRYLDYNVYSRSPEHKAAVKSLRNGELRSWESKAKYLIENKREGAVEFVAKHPGTMLRMLTYILRNGFPEEEVATALAAEASSLSTQTLANVLYHFGRKSDAWESEEIRAEAASVYNICETVLRRKMETLNTALTCKKVFMDFHDYNLEKSILQTNNKSSEGGYVRSGLAYQLPENVDRLRFFVYWNDKYSVDIDLHATATTTGGGAINIGWNGDYCNNGLCFSGDITHSDAAEYIDIDMTADISQVTANINLFSGKDAFKNIEECYVGIMAVDKLGEEIKLYNPSNCFFAHHLTSNCCKLNYGYIDVQSRTLIFDGKEGEDGYYSKTQRFESKFTLQRYLDIFSESQAVELVDKPEDADVVLVMEKASSDKEVSLIDENFFM